ncbi:WXG100 family type VII secretion target [Amycolatopsis plumensis]|uniref:WXG100 family type VII secretion target n=1 Tax=Amycolatopsis plumensis TaxID=236508 RepID=A0ABV5UHL3_9PSEU
MAEKKKWSDVKAILDDPSVPPAQKSALISSWLRENPPPPPFLADQEPDEIKQKRQEAEKYANAYNANPLFAGQSVDEAYDKAKQSGDQNSYNEDQEKKAVDDGKKKLDETQPPSAESSGGTKTSDEIFDAAAPALKVFETFGSLLAKIPADCRGNTRALDLDKDIRTPFDEQRGISFADFVADAGHFKRGSETVDRTLQDTGSQLGTLFGSWSGAGADAASDTYNDKIQPKAAKLSQTLGTASEATLNTATTVFQLCKGKADAVIGMYTDLVGKADYTMAQKVVAVANGEHGNEQDLAQIAGWMDLNFGTNLVKTLNDQGCCDGDEIKKHGQDLAKQWVQNQFNPDMWDRLYQGFVKTCKDTKDLVDQAYDALDKVMGGIRNEFEGVSLPGGPGSGSGGAGTAGGAGGGPAGSGSGGAGTAGGAGGGPGGSGTGAGSGSGGFGSGGGSGGAGSSGSGSGGAGSGGAGGPVPSIPETSSGAGASAGGSGGGSGAGSGGPVPSIPETDAGAGAPGGGSGTDLPSGAGSGSGSGVGSGGGGSVPPIPDGSTPSGGGATGGGSGSSGQDDGAAAAEAAKQQAAQAAEEAKQKAAAALNEFSGPGIQTDSGAGAGLGSGGGAGSGSGPGSDGTTPSSVPPPSDSGQDAAAAAAEAAKKKAADALKEFSGPGIETESGDSAGGGSGSGSGSGSGDDGKAAAEQAAEEAKKKAADALKEFSGPGIETESGDSAGGGSGSGSDSGSGDDGKAAAEQAAEEAKKKAADALKEFSGPGIETESGDGAGEASGKPDGLLGDDQGDDEPDVLKVKQGDKTFEMTEPDHDGKMDIKVGDGPGAPKDFKLNWSEAKPGDSPQGTDPDTYRPGTDGKIHIRDGDLEITAERPDGPDGPTVVTVDDGKGTPTTYTLGEDDKPASALGDTPAKQVDDLPTHRGTLEDLAQHPGGDSSHPSGDGSHHGPGDGSPSSSSKHDGDGGSHHAGDSSPGSGSGHTGGGSGSHPAGIGGAHAASGFSGAGFDPSGAGLGESPVSGGAHTGAGPVQPQPAFASAAGGPSGPTGAAGSSMSGMPGMGAMGGAQGGGGDTERRAPAYRIEGAVFDNLGEPGRRIIGSLDDEDPPSRTW